MPRWTSKVPDDPRGQGLPLVRTPAAGSLKAIVTSDNLIGCDTHFWGGHTIPCQGPGCPADEAGIAYRWHGYLSAYNPNDQLHFIFEMTAQAAKIFSDYRVENGTLRCCAFEAWRWKHTRNGRVMIKTNPGPLKSIALPQAPNLEKVMAIIWRLPIPNVEVHGINRNQPAVHILHGGDGQSSDPLDYDQPQP